MKDLRFVTAIAVLLMTVSSSVQAVSCDRLGRAVRDAGDYLEQAANESDLEDAQDYAGQAKSELDDAASAARNCDCRRAYREFDDAASNAGDAEDADNEDDFESEIGDAISAYEDGVRAIKACARNR